MFAMAMVGVICGLVTMFAAVEWGTYWLAPFGALLIICGGMGLVAAGFYPFSDTSR